MAQYPLDQKFRDAVENLPGYGGMDSSYMLINNEVPGSQLFRGVVEAGYSNELS